MAQIQTLIDIVKKQLKSQGMTYANVAKKLELSEASVKRLFSEQNFTLQRLESIAELLGYELSDLMQLVVKKQHQLTELTILQEKEIANDISLLLVTVCVMNHFTFQEILNNYHISKTDCIRKLATLDRLKIIELLPNNRIKLLISPNFKWLKKGPIQEFFQQKIQQDFFKSNFDKNTETLNVLNGMLSTSSIKILQNKMQRMIDDFNTLLHDDSKLDKNEKIGITMVMAEREWEFSIFNQFRR